MPRVAVQLIVYHSAKTLPNVLACIIKQSYQDLSLFVWDNSCDESESRLIKTILEQCTRPWQLIVANENTGFMAHNEMFRQNQAEYVLVLNDDAFIEPEYIEKLITFMDEHPDCASASGLIFRIDDVTSDDRKAAPETLIDAAGLAYISLARVMEKYAGQTLGSCQNELKDPQQVFGVSGTVAMYRRNAVTEVSPDGTLFDKTFFMYKEDVELALRLNRMKYVSYLVPTALAWHARSVKAANQGLNQRIKEERKRNFRLRICSYRNQWLIYFYHFSSALGSKDIIRSCFYELGRGFLVLVSSPSAFLKSWTWILQSLFPALRKRKELMRLGLANIKML